MHCWLTLVCALLVDHCGVVIVFHTIPSCGYMYIYCLFDTNFSFVGSKSMSPYLAPQLGGVLSKGERLACTIPLRYSSFCFDKKGGEDTFKTLTNFHHHHKTSLNINL